MNDWIHAMEKSNNPIIKVITHNFHISIYLYRLETIAPSSNVNSHYGTHYSYTIMFTQEH